MLQNVVILFFPFEVQINLLRPPLFRICDGRLIIKMVSRLIMDPFWFMLLACFWRILLLSGAAGAAWSCVLANSGFFWISLLCLVGLMVLVLFKRLCV